MKSISFPCINQIMKVIFSINFSSWFRLGAVTWGFVLKVCEEIKSVLRIGDDRVVIGLIDVNLAHLILFRGMQTDDYCNYWSLVLVHVCLHQSTYWILLISFFFSCCSLVGFSEENGFRWVLNFTEVQIFDFYLIAVLISDCC